MPRRRYRLLTVCAVVIVMLLYRVVENAWQPDQQPIPASLRPPPAGVRPPPAHGPQGPLKDGHDKPPSNHVGQGKTGDDERVAAETAAADGHKSTPALGADPRPTNQVPHSPTPDASSRLVGDEEPLRWKDPSGESTPTTPPTGDKVHWTKPEEHFPVPKESIIPLPTGRSKKLPKIQYDFGPESEQARTKRVQRQTRVKAELERAWAGYRKHAWMHDELSPVSGKFRNPFCRWAATLVDSLDTLWIAGLRNEFDEAANAVKGIDFTYTPRNDIPVFETTIRYLGGLIAAFDVSGGAQGSHAFLLDKAVELAEILMGVFDTPNRMPILYYLWQPQHASQPHRASRVGIAELATLSMEFTRLAQLTAQPKYYDAIDRITNALVEMQREGTAMPGLFPESLDASGCNRTATNIRDSLSQAAKDQVDSQAPLAKADHPGRGPAALNSILDSNRERESQASTDGRLARRAVGSQDSNPTPTDKSEKKEGPYAAGGQRVEWDCVPQGLVPAKSGPQKFHLAGAQDSAYEYFPKQYILLGGQEPKYQKLYEDAADAINEQLLFRPMITGDWDVLFPARAITSRDASTPMEFEHEMTHLTCFIGGMYGLGGRLFGRDRDVETAKKLTNGCVWAYQATASGLMPEFARLVPCPSLDKCEFNETLWWEHLDPIKDFRDQKIREWEAKQEEQKRLQKAKATNGGIPTTQSDDASREGKEAGVMHKRAVVTAHGQKKTAGPKDEHEGSELPQSLKDKLGDKFGSKDSTATASTDDWTDDDTDWTDSDGGSPAQVPTTPKQLGGGAEAGGDAIEQRPLSHEEYVKESIEQQRLWPGLVSVLSADYLLRPEAIESVWYMYRITGDDSWMDKGWDMFQATVRATRTAIANSAVSDVLAEEPELMDEMESFWIAETLKYYYLLFSEPEVISLDEWVLNTEAHPFKL